MLSNGDVTEPRLSEVNEEPGRVPEAAPSPKREAVVAPPPEASESELFDLYEKIAEARPGTRDAEIFEKLHEWSFSDFSLPPHEFAGITREQLVAWQTRHRINLSAGHIRPARIDLDRGYAWGQIRMTASVNRLHSVVGPPSADEVRQMVPAGSK
jgi:hypothetical protein